MLKANKSKGTEKNFNDVGHFRLKNATKHEILGIINNLRLFKHCKSIRIQTHSQSSAFIVKICSVSKLSKAIVLRKKSSSLILKSGNIWP